MSGIKGPSLMTAASAVGGAVAGQLLTKLIPASVDANLRAAAPLVAGYFAGSLIKGPNGQAFGLGMMAVGGVNVVKTLAPSLLSGTPMIAGYRQARRLSGPNTDGTPMIAGMPTIARNPMSRNTRDYAWMQE